MKPLTTSLPLLPRARWFSAVILGLVGGAAVAVALGGTGCWVEPSPVAPVGRYYVMHAHVHGSDCGHYRVWNDSMWVYYYEGHWEYHNPGSHRWVYYSAGHVPTALHGHESSAKSHRPYAVPGYVRDSGEPPRATKAAPRDVDRPDAAKPHGGAIRKTAPPVSSGGTPSKRPAATKAPPSKSDHK